MTFVWTYHEWEPLDGDVAAARPLVADTLLQTVQSGRRPPVSVDGLIQYGDIAYLSCRILMLAAMAVHPEALYCASQALEKYMKAVLVHRSQSSKGYQHGLVRLAHALAGEFADPEFLLVCERLAPFEEAGRYPDNTVPEWEHNLNLLTFLDGFVVHARRSAGMGPNTFNMVRYLLEHDAAGNAFVGAAIAAVRQGNHYVQELLQAGYAPPDSPPAT